jgi:signal peptidase I
MSQPSNSPGHKSALESFKETIESLILAFILAFVFRAFVVEAFVIPTGSMADTLRGAHFRLTCPTCSNQYNFGFTQERHRIPNSPNQFFPKNYIPPYPINVAPDIGQLRSGIPICPLCGNQIDTENKRRASNGDRILVQKYIYQFIEPETWDVVVFKNPTDPTTNFIKRLVGRPGETVYITDGDVYIDGKIQRKPDDVQDALWLEAYNIDYEPALGQGRDLWQPPHAPPTPHPPARPGKPKKPPPGLD